jgi:hypothetical protein
MWIGMLLLLGLAIFIVWDSRRLRNEVDKPLSRKPMAAGYVPRGIVAWHFWLGMSVVAGLMALIEWDQPSLPPYTGRWSWVSHLAFEAFGGRGVFVLFAGLAVCAFLGGLVGWLRAQDGKRNVS